MNFLLAATKAATRRNYAVFFALVAAMVVGAFFMPWLFLVAGALALLFILAQRLEWGLYALAAMAFFTNWQMSLTTQSLQDFLNISLPGSITAPVGDLFALVLGVAFVIALVFGWVSIKKGALHDLKIPLQWYGIFILAATVAAMYVYDRDVFLSLKYVMRPMVFVFLAFVVMPYLIIDNVKLLRRVFWVWLGLGALVVLYGLVSLVVVPSDGWPRVTPFAMFGWAPLGYNHNLLAEPLVALIPIGLYLCFWVRRERPTWFVSVRAVTIGMIVVALLTLSRAAWLALLVELAILAWYHREEVRAIVKSFRRRPAIVAAVVIFVVYMAGFLTSSIVAQSNATRQTMLDIVLYNFDASPWIGYGPGTFIRLMGEAKVFLIEYGAPLDSHGFLQKILLEDGLAGLITFLVFLFFVFKRLVKEQTRGSGDAQYLALCSLMMVTGAVIFQLFNTSYFTSTMWLPIGLALVGVRLIKEKKVD